MTDRVVDGHGRVWVTTTRGAAELGDDVNELLIRDWTRRGLVQRHIHDRKAWYNLADLRKVESQTFDRTRPRAYVVDDETPGRSQSHSTEVLPDRARTLAR